MKRFDPSLTDLDPDADHAARCRGKEGFANGGVAHRVARRRNRRRRACSVYRCPDCHQFHIGSRGKGD